MWNFTAYVVVDDYFVAGKQWREKQMRKITDKVFNRFKDETGKAYLKFEDLYIAVLLVYK